MTRITSVLLVVVMVVGTLGAFPMAGAASSAPTAAVDGTLTYAQADNSTDNSTDTDNSSDNSSANTTDVAPGEMLSGVVGVQEAEFEGEIESRAFGIRVAKAASANAKADVVAQQLEENRKRLEELRGQMAELREARENGSISQGEYAARVAQVHAKIQTVKRTTEQSEREAGELPEDLLREQGVNVTAIKMLKNGAEELSGPEVARIAQTIAGPDAGKAPGRAGAGAGRGPGAGEGDDTEGMNASEALTEAEAQVETARERLDRAEQRLGENASDNATEALERARAQLERAEGALEDARAAVESGDEEAAVELAEQAMDAAEQATAYVEDALETADDRAGEPGGSGSDGGPDGGTDTSGSGSDG